MLPKIKTLQVLPEYELMLSFDSGERVVYDVLDDINNIEDFKIILTEQGLFGNVRLDKSRTVISWSDRVDLPSDTLLEYGTRI
jgi:hypothetical protein